MATHEGSEGTVKIGSNAIAEIRSFSLTETADTVEDTTMGDTARTFLSSLTGWSGSIDVFWDETDTSGQVACTAGAAITLNVYPEGADEDGQVSVYSSSLTAGDLHKLQRKHKDFLNTQTIDGMIDLILMKAENEDGSKAFTLEDKPILMREDVNVIAEIAAEMFGDISDAEELEKN